MKAYGTFPAHLDQSPDKADLLVLGRINRKASDRKASRRILNKTTRRTVKNSLREVDA